MKFALCIGQLTPFVLRWCVPSALLLTLAIQPASAAGQEQSGTALPKDLCYTFVRDGDVWTVCEGKRERISLKGNVLHYAVSPDGRYFAFITPESSSDRKAVPHKKLTLVSLRPEFKTNVTETEFDSLRSTCGTVLGYRGGSWDANDVISGKSLDVPFKHFYSCDSDRRTLVGWDQLNETSANLTLQVNGRETTKLKIFLNGGLEFDVSPDGQYLAYFRGDPASTQLCTMKIGSVTDCTNERVDEVGFDGISITNSGTALYSGGTSEECFYKDMGHFAKKRRPGYTERDECVAVYFWRSGMHSPALIEELGRYAQWITPEVAARLHEWASTRSPAPRQ